MTGDDLTIIVPVWQRTQHLARVYASAVNATPDAEVLFVVAEDDLGVVDALMGHGFEFVMVPWPGGERGDYARKINAGYHSTPRPVLFTGADDLVFHPGWYDAARALLDVPSEAIEVLSSGGILVGPDRVPRIGVVGTVDDCNGRTMAGTHSTHSLIARWYADQGGTAEQDHVIYHEGYWHEYCDDELVQTAMARHAYAHAYDAHVEHLHWLVGKADMDDVYRHGTEHSAQSRRLFHSRSRLWLRQRRNVQFPPRKAVPR